MNKYQKEYAFQKARFQCAAEAMKEAEKDFMRGKGLTDPEDGKPLECIWCVTWDDALFDKISEEFDALPEVQKLHTEYFAAATATVEAEKALLKFALALAPAGIRETLRRGAERDYRMREKLIDLAFRLDTRTLPKHLRNI